MHALEIGGRTKLDPKSDWTLLNIEPGREVDVVADAAERLPFPDDLYDVIYASHVLEHMAWQRTVAVLAEWRRVLRPGGLLEVWVPDFGRIVQAFITRVLPDGWLRENGGGDPFLWAVGRLFGVGGSEHNWHRSAFDATHLESCLRRAGFADVFPLARPRGADHGIVNLGRGARK